MVDQKTDISTIEGAFDSFTKQRKDIAIVLINQHVRGQRQNEEKQWRAMMLTGGQIADKIRGRVDSYSEAFPSVLEIPSKDHPYDPEKDSVMKRVRKLFGE